ncbi:hypothetical protein TNCV_1108211 [Trichonephila clavipes]|nr:hypothetical protein TNCV_1108211 [Trichonephila clavipes]
MLQDYDTSFSRLYFSQPRFSSPPRSLSPPFRPFPLSLPDPSPYIVSRSTCCQLKKSSKLDLKQKGKNLTHGHLLLLLQKNEIKFRRLMYYLKMKDASEIIRKQKYDDLPEIEVICPGRIVCIYIHPGTLKIATQEESIGLK